MFFLLLGFLLVECPALAQGGIPNEREELSRMENSRYSLLRRFQNTSNVMRPYKVTYYKLDLNFVNPGISGVVTAIGKCQQDGLNQISFDLAAAMTVDSVWIDGISAVYSHSTSLLNITCNHAYNTGEIFSVSLLYHGNPVASGFGSVGDSIRIDGAQWIWTLSEPYGASDWWPCINHPSSKADSVDVWITCLSTYKAVSQGKLMESRSNGNGTTTYKWKHRYPIASYLISVTLTNFITFSDWFKYSPADSMEIVNYVTPNIETNNPSFRTNVAKTPRMLKIFSDLFGQYPFIKEKYGHVEFGWGGGMEHQTITSLGTYAFTESTIAHELAHQWFGDMITCRSWSDLWLNEGFASYCEALYDEKQYGTSSYNSDMVFFLFFAKSAHGNLHLTDTVSSGGSAMFDFSLVYSKGASVLHMLRYVLGDSVFFASMKAYANEPSLRFSSASTSDFRGVCERVSGKDLKYFFDEWIEGELYPIYSHSLRVTPQGRSFQATVRIRQTTGTANPAYFNMPLDLRFFGSGLDTTVSVFNTAGDQSFSFTFAVSPDSVKLDPDNWILKDIQKAPTGVHSDPFIPQEMSLQQNFPNPFNPTTTIRYELSSTTRVALAIYDILGRKVKTLIDKEQPAGYYSLQWDALHVSSGIYFCRLNAGMLCQTKKMAIIK
jgi:aminopeptidase N